TVTKAVDFKIIGSLGRCEHHQGHLGGAIASASRKPPSQALQGSPHLKRLGQALVSSSPPTRTRQGHRSPT
ncbi:hypothetical protein TYRP_022551, partial [Tyrophagus putrescentiae]